MNNRDIIKQSRVFDKLDTYALNIYETTCRWLPKGVFLWVETKGTGHTFISVHTEKGINVFSYGRYANVSPTQITGDGVLVWMQDNEAIEYMSSELYRMEAQVYNIRDADIIAIMTYFKSRWHTGKEVTSASANEPTKKFGRVIDTYDLTGVNCTTHSIKALNYAGSKVFERKNIFSINYTEDFTIPYSLRIYMNDIDTLKKSMIITDVTWSFKQQMRNTKGLVPLNNVGKKQEAFGVAAKSAGMLGTQSSGYGGATFGGSSGWNYTPKEE
ncbi:MULTISPECIES: hypothetical protein [unclassified Xenorhabdus]|uniref:hypothetical protein n=1 Tax=unclassified Xenorhabdus TaxID=2632833 RepID=UPI000C041967|nr:MULTISPECIES: hypothetical protein [unclassified Xenorhabdus]MCC8366360.1 hypothetical protein [Xenorhabdus sp. PB61.4]PHM51383.1 hypothetical protein Xekk_03783 [Xenorhabdus sp. KK7.4]